MYAVPKGRDAVALRSPLGCDPATAPPCGVGDTTGLAAVTGAKLDASLSITAG